MFSKERPSRELFQKERTLDLQVIYADYQNADHADAILSLMQIYASDIMGGGEGLTDHARQQLVAELDARADAFSILCYSDKQAVALATCFEGFSTFACKPLINIHDVIVLPEFRGKGISQLLLAGIEAEARRRGCCKLTLEVLEGNTTAINAYRKYGFDNYQLDESMGKAMFWEMKLGQEPVRCES